MTMIISLRLPEFILICLTQKTQAGNILTTNWNSFIHMLTSETNYFLV